MTITVIDPLKLDELVRDKLMSVPSGIVIEVRNGAAVTNNETGLPRWVLEELVRLSDVRDGAIRVPTGAEILSSRRAAAEHDARKATLIRQNPFDPTGGHWNITRQVELRRDDPHLAAELQSLAPRVVR